MATDEPGAAAAETIVELEVRIAFLQETVAQLSSALAHKEVALQQLEGRVGHIESALRMLAARVPRPGEDVANAALDPVPHSG